MWPILAVLMWIGPSDLKAADILIDDFWQRNASIDGVSDGQIIYLDSIGNEKVRDLAEVQAIRVPAFPDLGRAHDALQKGDTEAALEILTELTRRVRQPWLKHWIQWHRMKLLDDSGRPVDAVLAFVDLDRTKSDSFYLSQVPTRALAVATDRQKRDLRDRLVQAMPGLSEPSKTALEPILNMLAASEPDAPKAASDRASKSDRRRDPASMAAQGNTVTRDVPPAAPSVDRPSAVLMPAFMSPDDPITDLLRRGRFREALGQLEKALRGKAISDINLRWYQRGLARVKLAEEERNRTTALELYKYAGLDFMRVVVFFPRGRYRSVCLIETGYVHQQIGRSDKARALLEEAQRGAHALDPDSEPNYQKRLKTLLSTLKPSRSHEQ